jgi:hypothetical protein
VLNGKSDDWHPYRRHALEILLKLSTLSSTGHWALTRHCRLTDSPARTNMVLFIHRTVRLVILRVVDLRT